MVPCLTLSRFVRRFLGYTAAGAGVVLLAKPLVITAVVIGVCATVGFLMWLPLRGAVAVHNATWHSVCGRGRRWLEPVGHKCRQANQAACTFIERAAPVVSSVLLEGLSAAVVAVVLALAAGARPPRASPVVPVAALCGALAGGLLVFARKRREGRILETDVPTEISQGASRSSTQPPSS
jgi:hypothetical protein